MLRAGIGRAFAAGGDLPHHAAAHRLVQQLADGRAVDAEYLEALVEVVGHHEAGHRVDLQRSLHLVDARLRAFGAHGRGRIDEAEQPARRAQQARAQQQRAGPIGDRLARRRDGAAHRQLQRAAEGVEHARALQRRAAGQQQVRRRDRRRVAHALGGAGPVQAVAHRQAEQLGARAVERGREHIEVLHRAVERAVGVFQRLVDLAGVILVERVFGGEPVGDRIVQRPGRAAGELRAAAQRGGGTVEGGARAIQVHRAELPGLQRRRIQPLDGDFPFDPHRHPGLRPGGDADEVGVGALVERELAQLVGHERLLLLHAGPHAGRCGTRAS